MVLAALAVGLGIGACGGGGHHATSTATSTAASSTQHHYTITLPNGSTAPSAHSPTFGLPPKRLIPVAPKSTPTLLMLDTVTPSSMSGLSPPAVAGYTSGSWPTFDPLVALYPHAYHVSVAVNANHGQVSTTARDCIDSEPGDATATQAGWWVHWEIIVQHVDHPCVYASLSNMGAVVGAISSYHIVRSQYFLWDADWVRFYRLDAGFDCTQYDDTYQGRNIDPNACTLAFLGAHPAPPPPDPFRIFPKVTYTLRFGHRASEYRTVGNWYRYQCKRPVVRSACKSTYLNVRLLRDREYWVAHHRVVHGRWVEVKHARWNEDNLGGRFHWTSVIVFGH